MCSTCTVLVWYFLIVSHFDIIQINEKLDIEMLDISMVVSFAKVFCRTDIVCKTTFSSILVIVHPIDVHFKKSSPVISITLNDDKDSITTKSTVNKEDKSNLQDENELRNGMLYFFKLWFFFTAGVSDKMQLIM